MKKRMHKRYNLVEYVCENCKKPFLNLIECDKHEKNCLIG